jgi:hypothetical protein
LQNNDGGGGGSDRRENAIDGNNESEDTVSSGSLPRQEVLPAGLIL